MKNNSNIIKEFTNKYFRYWPIGIIIIILFIIIGFLYYIFSSPVYDIKATLIIHDENRGMSDDQVLESINAFESAKIIENELEVLKSRSLLEKVVDSLNIYTSLTSMEDQMKLNYVTSPLKIKLAHVFKISDNLDSKIEFTYNAIDETIFYNKKEYPLDTWIKGPFGDMKFLKNKYNQSSENKETKYYFTYSEPRLIVDDLIKNIDVSSTSKLSTVIDLSLKDFIPKRGEDVLNTLIYFYKEQTLDNGKSLATQTLKFIEDRINKTKKELSELEIKEQNYKSSKGVVDLSEQGRLYLQSIENGDSKIIELKLQLSSLNDIEDYMLSNSDLDIIPSTMGIDSENLNQLFDRLNNAKIEYEQLKETVGLNNPMVKTVKSEINQTRNNIIENVRNLKKSLNNSLIKYSSSVNDYNSTLGSIPEKERQLIDINRQKAIKNDIYSYLLQKIEDTALSFAPSSGDIEIIDYAQADLKPVSPSLILTGASSLFGGILCCILLVLFKEITKYKAETIEEVIKSTNIPIVTEIFPNHFNKNKNLNEDINNLRLALGIYSNNPKNRTFLLTSSGRGESNNLISENLAINLSHSKKDVLYINFDDNFCKIESNDTKHTLVDVITNQATFDQCISSTNFENLFLIDATQKNINELNLFDYDFKDLFKKIKDKFYYVILNCPPINSSSIYFLLSIEVDKTINIVKLGSTPLKFLNDIESYSDKKTLNNSAIVIEHAKKKMI